MTKLDRLASKYAPSYAEGGRAHGREEETDDEDSEQTIYKALGGPVVPPVQGAPPPAAPGQAPMPGQPSPTPPVAAAPIQAGQAPPSDILQHLSNAIQGTPSAAPVLKAHALALLRANLNAAHAIHTLTGDPTAYGHYQTGARALSQALGGNSDSVTAQMIAQQDGGNANTGGVNPQALAPAAIMAASQAVHSSKS